MNTPRVLVVEDDARTARFFAAAADRLGFEAQVAKTGEEAIACLAETVPDLILLDLRLPGISGWEILPQIRADPDNSHPVTLINGHTLKRPLKYGVFPASNAVPGDHRFPGWC